MYSLLNDLSTTDTLCKFFLSSYRNKVISHYKTIDFRVQYLRKIPIVFEFFWIGKGVV